MRDKSCSLVLPAEKITFSLLPGCLAQNDTFSERAIYSFANKGEEREVYYKRIVRNFIQAFDNGFECELLPNCWTGSGVI